MRKFKIAMKRDLTKNFFGNQSWPLTCRTWVMQQTWNNVWFIHLPVSSESLRHLIPQRLQIDTYQGQAWIGIVLFVMEGIYLRGVPVKLFPSFPEINVRTYVTFNGKPGVFFLSLDAEHWVTYTLGKKWFRLPYFYSHIAALNENQSFTYHCVRKDRLSPPAAFNGTVTPVSDVYFSKPGTLEYWLIERYRLFSVDSKGRIYSGEIHHVPWPLQKGEGAITMNTLISPFHAAPVTDAKPIFHFSSGVNARIWNIKKQ